MGKMAEEMVTAELEAEDVGEEVTEEGWATEVVASMCQ